MIRIVNRNASFNEVSPLLLFLRIQDPFPELTNKCSRRFWSTSCANLNHNREAVTSRGPELPQGKWQCQHLQVRWCRIFYMGNFSIIKDPFVSPVPLKGDKMLVVILCLLLLSSLPFFCFTALTTTWSSSPCASDITKSLPCFWEMLLALMAVQGSKWHKRLQSRQIKNDL